MIEPFFDTFLGKLIFSLLSSTLFVIFLIVIARPNIVISQYICYNEDEEDDDCYYIFKIVNKTWFNSVYNVEFNLESLTPQTVNGGQKINYRLKKLDLNVDKRNSIKTYIPFTNDGNCAFLIRTNADIRGALKNRDIRLSLTVHSRHGFSNLTKVKKREFINEDCIKDGAHFKYGKHLDIYK